MAKKVTSRRARIEVEELFAAPTTEKQKAIIEAAVALIGQRGIDGATTAEIARHAGVTEKTLFRYFVGLCANDLLAVDPQAVQVTDLTEQQKKEELNNFLKRTKRALDNSVLVVGTRTDLVLRLRDPEEQHGRSGERRSGHGRL